ncbi:MAG TPA: SprT family zinc-dependent metalloprotease [Bacteroidia bacterium]|jgi:predicted metal-dependent hydrolase|nr:SprT family zinc-dependent metalloprotease [Bacteroidia bacterium]
MEQVHTISYGTTEIDFKLSYSTRKTLGITVNPDLTVRVIAPYNSSIKKVKDKVEKKARWIVRQKEFFGDFLPKTPAKEYVSGETHLYVGKQYRLKLIKARARTVKMTKGYINVYLPDKAEKRVVMLLLNDWYREHALRIFEWRIKANLERFKKHKIEYPKLIVRRMEKRWGSCTPNGTITLNPEIIKAPVGCIDYVIIHELCHIVNRNHDKKFYQLQARVMPDWKKWKDRLEKILV